MILAIDTSTDLATIALYRPAQGVLFEQSWLSGREQTTQLMPNVQRALSMVGAEPRDLTGIAVATGPGSFSGVRIGISAAKSMAYALEIPIWGVPSLDALAYQHQRHGATVAPLIRLGRERFATTGLSTREPRNVTLAELCAEINGRALLCGDIDAEVRETLRLKLGQRAQFPTPAANLRRPGFLAELAWQRFQAGETDDATTLEPIYLGQPVKVKT